MPSIIRITFTALALSMLAACWGGNSSAGGPSLPPANEEMAPDANANGVPDALDKYVEELNVSSDAKVAATNYYRLILRLSNTSLSGGTLTPQEKELVFHTYGCYSLTVAPGGETVPPLDAEYMKDMRGYNAMQALSRQMSGTVVQNSMDKSVTCQKAAAQ